MRSLRSGAGPRTGIPGATSLTGKVATGGGATPHSCSQDPSCADETAYTIGPRPTHACAAAHMGQCSPEVYTVQCARVPELRLAAAQRAIANSGGGVRSPPAMGLGPSTRTSPSGLTSDEPGGSA